MSIRENSPAYSERFWAKSEPRDGYPKRIHLLEHNLADVGACFEMLLAQPNIQKRLARSGGLEFLDKTTAARLSVLAAMHDIDKINVGFQTQIWRDEEMPGGRRPMPFRRVGHTMDLTPVLDQNKDSETAEWFFESLGWWWDAVESWMTATERWSAPCLLQPSRTMGSRFDWKMSETQIRQSGGISAV